MTVTVVQLASCDRCEAESRGEWWDLRDFKRVLLEQGWELGNPIDPPGPDLCPHCAQACPAVVSAMRHENYAEAHRLIVRNPKP